MAASPMRTISLRTIIAHKLRLVLTVLSVVLGTAFIAGSSIFTTSLSDSFSSIISTAFDDTDLVVMPGEDVASGIPLSTIEKLRANPDVKGVGISNSQTSVVITGSDGKALQTGGAPAMAFAVDPAQQSLGALPLTEGNYPTQPDEIAITTTAAEKGNINVGDTITALTANDRTQVKVTGIMKFGTDAGGWVGVAFPESVYLQRFTDGEKISQASVSLNDAAATDSMRDTLTAEFPELKVETGQALVEQTTKDIKQQLSFMNYFLWAFAGIALLVGTFIISNTFAMIVAQRIREFALLRSIGTKQSQITRSVMFEAAVVGLVGSVLGIVAGMGIVRVIYAVLNARGAGLPSSGAGLSVQAVVTPIVVGLIVTVLSAVIPALRAGRVRPVQAMRSGDQSSSNSLVVRTVFGGVIGVLGLCLVVVPMFMDSAGLGLRTSMIGIGAFFLVIGLWLAGPLLSIPLVGSLGRVIGAPFSVVGRLAATNSRRNPRRTAATSFALTLGLMMVSSIGMLGATMRENTEASFNNSVAADFVLTGPTNSTMNIPKEVPERIAGVEDVDSVATIYNAPILVNHRALDGGFGGPTLTVLTGDYETAYELTVLEGSIDTTSPNAIVLNEDLARSLNVKVGDEVDLNEFSFEALQASGNSYDMSAGALPKTQVATVQAIIANDSAGMAGFVPLATAEELIPAQKITTKNVFIKGNPGANQQTLRENLEAAVADDLVVSVLSKSEFAGQATQGISQMLSILYGLLGLAVIIAILGIVNTLALSVVERRQEIGMLRAVGTQRRQVRRMIYIESAVIAIFGALLGAVVGLGVGWSFVSVLGESGLEKIVIPWSQVAAMLVASGFIGVLAAVWPGHKAAKTKPLDAITV